MSDDSIPGTWQNALRELDLSVLTDADRARIDLVRRASIGREATSERFRKRFRSAELAIARARKWLRLKQTVKAYETLSWRRR